MSFSRRNYSKNPLLPGSRMRGQPLNAPQNGYLPKRRRLPDSHIYYPKDPDVVLPNGVSSRSVMEAQVAARLGYPKGSGRATLHVQQNQHVAQLSPRSDSKQSEKELRAKAVIVLPRLRQALAQQSISQKRIILADQLRRHGLIKAFREHVQIENHGLPKDQNLNASRKQLSQRKYSHRSYFNRERIRIQVQRTAIRNTCQLQPQRDLRLKTEQARVPQQQLLRVRVRQDSLLSQSFMREGVRGWQV